MSDNGEADTEEPAVPLGEGEPVEGAPTARVAARLHYPIEESEVLRREGDTTIRTPDGPRDLGDVLAESDEVYFPDRQSLVDTVEGVIGTGPIPTEGDDGSTGGDSSASAGETGASDDVEAEAETESDEPDNAAEAPEGEGAGSPDDVNAAEAPEDRDEDDEPTVEADEGASADEQEPADQEAVEKSEDEDVDEGEFEFNDPEE